MTIRYQYPEVDPFWEQPLAKRINYFDDETTANEWLVQLVRRMSWDLQEDNTWFYNINEVEPGCNPKIKDDKFFEVVNKSFNKNIIFLQEAIMIYLLRAVLHSDIDLDDDSIAWLLDEGYGDELVDFHQLIPKWMKQGKNE